MPGTFLIRSFRSLAFFSQSRATCPLHIRLIKKLQNLSIILHCVDSPQFNGVAFKLDAHTHFAARVRSADIEETPLNSSHRRRRTKAKEEVTRGSRKLKPITPPLKGKGLHTLLFLMRPFPHGVLDTSAESIPNFETKNKVLTHFLAMLTQFSARFRCETWIRGRNSVTF